MARTTKEKKAVAGVKTEKTKKTTKAKEQIAKLEKALESIDEKKVLDLIPEEVKADIVEDNVTPVDDAPVDFDAEVKKILENPEPSEEIKEEIAEFEEGKKTFEEKLEKAPEKTEEIVQEEIDRVESIKKKLEALQEKLKEGQNPGQKINGEAFTNIWNGTNFGF